jgi:hypothetical protein
VTGHHRPLDLARTWHAYAGRLAAGLSWYAASVKISPLIVPLVQHPGLMAGCA